MATTFTVEVDWTKTGTWVDETSRTRRVKCWAGFKAPGDPVAAVGRCVLTLDNSAQRFSPGNTAGALFGNLLPMRPVRVKATSGSTWTLFRGFIDRILPDVGKYGGQECVLECVDALAILAAQRASVVYAASKTVKDTVIALVESVYAPPAEDIVDNGDLVAHYGRAWRPEDIDIDGALREVDIVHVDVVGEAGTIHLVDLVAEDALHVERAQEEHREHPGHQQRGARWHGDLQGSGTAARPWHRASAQAGRDLHGQPAAAQAGAPAGLLAAGRSKRGGSLRQQRQRAQRREHGRDPWCGRHW